MCPNLPISSGISPNFTKSSGSNDLSPLVSVLLLIKPIDAPFTLFFATCSMPTKAPPQIKSMFVVSTSMNSALGCFLPPVGGTLNLEPSITFNSACCTPSPDTSLVIDVFSLLRDILSISSKNIMPCSAFSTSKSHTCNNLLTMLSTSSPT